LSEITNKNFGLLIAYVLPGFVTLWGLQPFSSTLQTWFAASPTLPAGIQSVVFVGTVSIAAGMTIGAIRWLLIDTLHHCTGLKRPIWDDAKLETKLNAFDMLVEAHYRYYQFYAHMAVVIPILFIAWQISYPTSIPWSGAIVATLAEVLFFAASRDALQKYYARGSRLLGIYEKRSVTHDER
jgi:hypothetical protein